MILSLFKCAILYHPKDGDTMLVRKSHSILAKDVKNAAFLMARLIPDEYENNLDCIEILVKQFNARYINLICTTSNSLLISNGTGTMSYNNLTSQAESFNAHNLTLTT